jgi:phosphatidylserine decarboxylase
MAPSALGIAAALALALPLAWKWELGLVRVATGLTALGVLAAAVLAAGSTVAEMGDVVRATLVGAFTIALGIAALAYRFYRDPERSAPERDDVIVSPADGEIVYVRRSTEGMLPVAEKHGRSYPLSELVRTPLAASEAVVVGIAMSFLDVHVNRAPLAGRVAFRRHFPGLFGSLKHAEMVFRNERMTTVIERDGLQLAVVQIASRLVRQIVSFVREGESVTMAQRIGVIRLGSQVDLVLPASEEVVVVVRPGQRVRAGETVLATIEPTPVERPSQLAAAGVES